MTIQATVVPATQRYEVNEITGCWLWLGYVNKDGYARLGEQNAHRVLYEVHVGPVPAGFDVDHLCKRRNCVNPAHLEAITELENNHRRTRTITYQGKRFDVCREGHALEGVNLIVRNTTQGGTKRICRECQYLKGQEKRVALAKAAGREYRPYKRRAS